jgi:hypothetical protein
MKYSHYRAIYFSSNLGEWHTPNGARQRVTEKEKEENMDTFLILKKIDFQNVEL